MRAQFACFGQLSSFLQNSTMVLASYILNQEKQHEHDVEGEPSNVNVGEVMGGAGCDGNNGSTDLGGCKGIVEARGSHCVETTS